MTGAYLAQAIDQDRLAPHAVNDAGLWLAANVDWVYDPSQAFAVYPEARRDGSIRAINNTALDRADVLVAFLMAGTITIGVPMEIERAAAAGKIVCVVSDAPSWALQYDEPNVEVFPEWGDKAQAYISEALRGISERLSPHGRASLPVMVHEAAGEPRRGYADDAGLDLVVSAAVVVEPGEFRDIPCGVNVQLPEGVWGLLTGRSSTLRKRGLLVNQGIIDTGYRGPLFAGVWNMTDRAVHVSEGERLAQLILLPNLTQNYDVIRVKALESSERGHAGFGSTGA